MTKLYKLTNRNHETHNRTKWGEGVTHTASGVGELCGPGWLHAYTDPLLAVFLNPVHANFKNLVLWEAEGDIAKSDNRLKVGCTKLTTVRVMPLPEVTTTHRVAFAILCAIEVYKEPHFVQWACEWLNGNRTAAPTEVAGAAKAAAEAAWAAVRAAAEAVWEASRAAGVAGWAAEAASWASEAETPIDLIALAHKAMEVK